MYTRTCIPLPVSPAINSASMDADVRGGQAATVGVHAARTQHTFACVKA